MNENEKVIICGAVECLLAISLANKSNEAIDVSKAIDFVADRLERLIK